MAVLPRRKAALLLSLLSSVHISASEQKEELKLTAESVESFAQEFREQGVVRLPNALPATWLKTLRGVSVETHKQYYPEAKTISDLLGGTLPESFDSSDNLMCFSDVIQRGPGKVEIKLSAIELKEKAETDALQDFMNGVQPSSTNNPWSALINAILGSKDNGVTIENLSFFFSYHHSTFKEFAVDQTWHSDASWYPGNETCQGCMDHIKEDFAVVVYLILSDINEAEGGGVEFIPRTHLTQKEWNLALMGDEMRDQNAYPVKNLPMNAGDVVIYSSRTVHRGRARKLQKGHRPVVKIDYFGQGIKDVDNPFCADRGALLRHSTSPHWSTLKTKSTTGDAEEEHKQEL